MSETEINKLARDIAYRYFNLPFDGDPETLMQIVSDILREAQPQEQER
jgi:hypothetical protein